MCTLHRTVQAINCPCRVPRAPLPPQVEEHKFKELREGARREAASRQAAKLAEAARCEETRSKSAAVRAAVAKQAARDKQDFLREYEERLSSLTTQTRAEQAQHTARLAARVTGMRDREASAKAQRKAGGYVPFTGSRTTLQARLAALAQMDTSSTASV